MNQICIVEERTTISAREFMQGTAHFITWTTDGSDRTGCLCYPETRMPFDLASVQGTVDAAGVFRATSVNRLFVDGWNLRSVTIERERDAVV